jgi:hypothetical protein
MVDPLTNVTIPKMETNKFVKPLPKFKVKIRTIIGVREVAVQEPVGKDAIFIVDCAIQNINHCHIGNTVR